MKPSFIVFCVLSIIPWGIPFGIIGICIQLFGLGGLLGKITEQSKI